MGFSYNVNVLNQKGSPALYTDTFANRPNFGYAGRLFIANDTSAIYEDTGTAWVLIANVSSGAGTLQQVTTNGNTSNVGISVTAGGISTNSLTDTALTLGSVLFSGAGGLVSQDNPAFFWDDTNNRLGINTNTPGNSLDVHSSGTNPILALNNTAGSQSVISFLNTSVAKWRIGNAATTNTFDIFNFGLSANAIKINNGDNSIEITNNINVQSNGSILGSNANGSDPVRIQANNVQKVIRFYNSAAGTADLYVAGTSTTSAFYFSTFSTANALRIEDSGSVLVNNPSDDGVNKLQVNGNIRLTGTLTNGTYSYTLPSATGTIALTSNLSSYLPLVGGTLTGTLNGTNLSLNGYLTGTGVNPGGLGGSRYLIDFSGNTSRFFSYGTDASTNGAFLFTSQRSDGSNSINFLSINSVGETAIGGTSESTIKLKVTGTTSDSTAYTYFARNLAGNGIFSVRNDGYVNFGISAANSPYNYNVTFSPRTAGLDASGGFGYIVSTRESKGNIQSINNIDYIKQLNPVSFNYRKKNIENTEYIDELYDDVYYGFIADEVEKVNKDLVFYENNENKKLSGVEYNSMIALLTKAYQQQQIIIDSLLKRIELLENK